jgi:hypothetical protein
MTYTKPILSGHSAIAVIQTSGQNVKTTSVFESNPALGKTQPAYEADE